MTFLKKLHTFANRYEWLILALAVVIIFRIPTLFTPHYYGDEEIYFVMGRAWREGVPMYEAMFDHKPPLLYVLAGIANTVFNFRLMLMASMVIHTIFFYLVASKLFAKVRPAMTYLSTAIFVILTTLPTFEGNIANAELFMMLPITVALYLIFPTFDHNTTLNRLTYTRYSPWRYLIAGLIAGIGWLFKVPVATDWASIALFIFPISQTNFRNSLRSIFSLSFILLVVGFVIPLASTFAYYFVKGHLESYLATVFTVNLGYVSSWSTSEFAFNPFKSGLIVRGMVVAGITLFVYFFRHKIDKRLQFVLLWLAFSFFGALLSGRPYPHYLQQPFVPLSLAIPFIFMTENLVGWILIGILAIWAIFTNRSIKFWAYQTWPLYTNFWQVTTRQLSDEQYLYSFDGARRNYTISKYLNERMQPEDKIFIWGSDTAIYNITDRLPSGGKYMVDFHIHDFHAEPYVMDNLNKSNPRFIIRFANAQPFEQLDQLLDTKYIKTLEHEGAAVYMRFEVNGNK